MYPHRPRVRLPERTASTTRRQRRAGLVTALMAMFAVALVGGAGAAGPYPEPPPAFPTLDQPHSRMLSPLGGTTDRPMLVMYVEFADETFEDTNPPPGNYEPPAENNKWSDTDFMDAGALNERFFGSAPSVADYFSASSGGELLFVPAVDNDASNGGAVNDGIVSLTIDENKAVDPDDPDAGGFIDWDDPQWAQQQETLLEMAAEHVDFSLFDKNGDGVITEDELAIVRHDVDLQHIPGGSGGNRSAPAGLALDGVQLGGSAGMPITNSGTATNLMTLVHEIGHAAFDMPDTYQEGIPELDIGSFTSSVGDLQLFEPNAWHKIHLDWIEPTVVTESGYYDVATGEAFVLYDPDQGTDEYLLVENRRTRPDAVEAVEFPPGSGDLSDRFVRFESYDQAVGSSVFGDGSPSMVSDGGLVIWRIDESEFRAGDHTYMELVSPDGSARMWDPDLGEPLADRTVQDHPWTDGTPSALAVRDIPPSDDVMRVYFDVRGPGVLLDPVTNPNTGDPFVMDVTPEEANSQWIPVMNTGDVADTFEVFYTDLPAGWDAESVEVELDAGEFARAKAAPVLIPAADAATGMHELTVAARSTADSSVRDEATLEVNVTLDQTQITYTGDTEGAIGTSAELSAVVTNFDDGDAPVEGVEVTFELTAKFGDDRQSVTAVTDADGVATTTPIVDVAPGSYRLRATTERFGKHSRSGTTEDFRVLTAAERVERLREDITDAGLRPGTERSLAAKLDETLVHLEADDEDSACNTLNAFSNSASAQRGRHIPEELADAWLDEAASIRNQLGC